MPAKKKIQATPNTVELPPRAVAKYLAAKQAAKDWAEAEATARAEIEAAFGDNEIGTVDGVPVLFWKFGKRTALSQALLGELYPTVLEECKVTTETRTMTQAKP